MTDVFISKYYTYCRWLMFNFIHCARCNKENLCSKNIDKIHELSCCLKFDCGNRGPCWEFLWHMKVVRLNPSWVAVVCCWARYFTCSLSTQLKEGTMLVPAGGSSSGLTFYLGQCHSLSLLHIMDSGNRASQCGIRGGEYSYQMKLLSIVINLTCTKIFFSFSMFLRLMNPKES